MPKTNPAVLKREEGRTRPSVPTQEQYDRMIKQRHAEIRKLCNRLKAGEIDVDAWADGFDGILFVGHSQAWRYGRQRAGDLRPLNEDDRLAGLRAKDLEAQWLNAFVECLNDKERAAADGGLYDEAGELKLDKLVNRAKSYTGKMRATAQQAFVDAGDDDEEYIWHLGIAEHCPDCPHMAALSPYTKQTLWTTPGAGDTECLGNCECWLERVSDSRTCFQRPA